MINKKFPKLSFILAMDNNNLIGNNNDLPWKLPADLKYFKQQTLNKTIVMGRKTCESLPFVLPNRRNIVLTRNVNFKRNGFEFIHTTDCLMDISSEIMVIGGAMIYQLLMPYAHRLLITKINHEFSGDTYFKWDENDWTQNSIIENDPDKNNPYQYSFIIYSRKTL